jgi:hypothetical protein
LFLPRRVSSSGWVTPALDDEVKVKALKRPALLLAGPTSNGGVREKDLLQFYADMGGLRTISVDSVMDVR